jgi:hypothetical protein
MNKYSHYFALEKEVVKKTRGAIDRADLIYQFTETKKNSLSQLNETEYREFLNWIKTTFKLDSKRAGEEPSEKWQNTPENKMRRKIIALFKQMDYILPSTGKADMNAINGWCQNYAKIKKPLNDYTKQELRIITTQVEIILDKFKIAVVK